MRDDCGTPIIVADGDVLVRPRGAIKRKVAPFRVAEADDLPVLCHATCVAIVPAFAVQVVCLGAEDGPVHPAGRRRAIGMDRCIWWVPLVFDPVPAQVGVFRVLLVSTVVVDGLSGNL